MCCVLFIVALQNRIYESAILGDFISFYLRLYIEERFGSLSE